MNFPNAITSLRALLSYLSAAILCISLQVPYAATVATALFILAGATDWIDGYVARKYNLVTTFGKFMDALCDKIMVICLFMVLFALGLYKDFTMLALLCAIISVSREFFVSGVRMIAANKGVVIAAETLGKYKAAFQMYSVGSIMFAFAMHCDFAEVCPQIIYDLAFYGGIGTLVFSTILSAWSGAGYAIKYSDLLKS